MPHLKEQFKECSHHLHRKATETERHHWKFLRQKQLSDTLFRRQFVIGPYIVDFICLRSRLIIEYVWQQGKLIW